ncbi:MAG: polysaccharide deacetylase family protein [Casimicrobiaceae bacterium]
MTAPAPIRWRPTSLLKLSVLLHLVAVAAIIGWPQQWRWALAAIVANHVLLTAVGLWPRSRMLGPNWTRLPDEAARRNEIAITIDDGPDPVVTPKVLDLLDRYQACATFFCVGRKVGDFPELCRDIVRRGHAIENHTANHRWTFSLLGLHGIQRELEAAQSAIIVTTGEAPRFFRAPAGFRNPLLEAVLCKIGLRLASWTRRGFDTRELNADTVLHRLLDGLAPGDILLVHDGNAARTRGGDPVILEVLPKLLEAVQAAGLRPVTLRSLLESPGPA